MSDDLDRLDKLAEAATPGPWEVRDESPSMGGENFTLRQTGVPGIRVSGYVYGFGTGIQEFIAAANPATVLALIERVKTAEAERDAALARHRGDALRVRDAVDRWEADGDDVRLVNDAIDPWIERALTEGDEDAEN